MLRRTREGIEKELGNLKHTTAGVAARMAAEETHYAKKREKDIETQASIKAMTSKIKDGGKIGKFKKICAKIYKQPSKAKNLFNT